MSPTYDQTAQFERQYRRLSPEQKEAFLEAVKKFVEDLRRGEFRKSLRVKGYQGEEGVYEMTWAPDGRALFSYGDEVIPGEPHIVWLRVGSHEIF